MARSENIKFHPFIYSVNMHWELGVGNVAALEIDKVSGVIEFTFWWVRQTIKKTSSQRHKEISDDNVGHKGYNEVMW